jgi:hypothetical protein
LPTPRTAAVGLALLATCLLASAWLVYPFLAVTRPAPGARIAVVEGWLSDDDLETLEERLRSGKYDAIVTTGGPLHKSSPLANYGSFAELCAERLRRSGIPEEIIVVAPAPYVRKDRTRASARAVAEQLARTTRAGPVDLISVGPHARRSWGIFRQELSPRNVGVLALPPADYDSESWWSTSAGVRGVLGEGIAYAAWLVLD